MRPNASVWAAWLCAGVAMMAPPIFASNAPTYSPELLERANQGDEQALARL